MASQGPSLAALALYIAVCHGRPRARHLLSSTRKAIPEGHTAAVAELI